MAAGTTTASGWVLAFQDTFSGTTIDRRKWGVFNGPGNGNTGPRSASNAFVRNGLLVLRNRKINGVWHGAGVSNARAHSQTYGKYEVRARVDAGEGLKANALLWPNNGDWPPEVDFFEVPAAPGDRPKYTVTNHYGTRAAHRMQHGKVAGRFTQWHVMGLEWTPTALRFTLDGRVVATLTGHAPRERMWLGLQTNVGGQTKPGPSTPPVVDFEIDWVRIFRKA
jgi:beta-glucanase (GH16 family)